MHLRDLNLGLEGNTKMTTITCVETMRKPQNPWNPPPVTFLFKHEGILATHPLSYHPQRVFGSRENERKKEKDRENKRSGKIPTEKNVLLIKVLRCLYKVLSGGYILPKTSKI